MNRFELNHLSRKVINDASEELGFSLEPHISNATQLYVRRMLLAYHQELINKGLLNHRQSDEG